MLTYNQTPRALEYERVFQSEAKLELYLQCDWVAEGLQRQNVGKLDCCFECHVFCGLVIGIRVVVVVASAFPRYSVEPNSPKLSSGIEHVFKSPE